MYKILLFFTFLIWTAIHIYFLWLNEVLKVADSFAYLQMSNYFNTLSLEWFGTGWFWFLYSIPIAAINFFLNNNFLSAQILNIILFNISWILLYKIAKQYLTKQYLILLILLFFLSPILLHFNITILSENIYIPLFLLIVLALQNFIEEPRISDWIAFWFLIALMYFTRWEAFIYLWAIWLVSLILLIKSREWKFSFPTSKFLSFNILLILSFWLFVSPYIYHLHNLTWDWGLSNKWSSNLRQAIMRWKIQMDDDGFEKAVAELTPDKKHLIAGFAWGLKYNKPKTQITLKNYILEDKTRFLNNWLENQKKLYSKNLPNIIDWNARGLYFNIHSNFFYKNKIFLIVITIPLLLFVIWIFNLYKNKKRDILIILFSFFFIASVFFTLFFTLNRYFIIFLPLFLVIIVYAIQTIDKNISFTWTGFSKKPLNKNKFSMHSFIKIFLSLNIVLLYSLWLLSYYNTYETADKKYEIKKIAWTWLNENNKYTNKNSPIIPFHKGDRSNLNILERFPIVTYYSETNNRFITPYTSSLTDLLVYAKFNKIDYLIVDTLDFAKYRPKLDFLLNEKKEFKWFQRIKTFKKEFNWKEQKVIIYKIK